jgi:hypothetical protein
MRNYLLSLATMLPLVAVQAQAQVPAATLQRTTVSIGLSRGYYTNHGWPGFGASLGLDYRFSDRSLFSLNPRISGFRADHKSLEPDKQAGEKYYAATLEMLGAVRTSRHPERLALRFELGPMLMTVRETELYRTPGSYLKMKPDGSWGTTIVTENQFVTSRFTKPGLAMNLGIDATLAERVYVAAGVESRTYSLFPGDLLSIGFRVGYTLR